MMEEGEVTENRVFNITDKVMCFYGPLAYEAKIRQVREIEDNRCEYFVHYVNWKNTWDEWVDSSRIQEYNDETIKQSKALAKTTRAKPKPVKRKRAARSRKKGNANNRNKTIIPIETANGDISVPNVPNYEANNIPEAEQIVEPVVPPVTRPKRGRPRGRPPAATIVENGNLLSTTNNAEKRKRNQFNDNLRQFSDMVNVHLPIPKELEDILIYDCEKIHNNKLCQLPSDMNVITILNNYMLYEFKDITKATGNILEGIREINGGIIEIFNEFLPKKLLLYEEQDQYEKIVGLLPDKTPAEIYGPQHFLRLFPQLGPALGRSSLNNKKMPLVVEVAQDILNFLVINKDAYFDFSKYS